MAGKIEEAYGYGCGCLVVCIVVAWLMIRGCINFNCEERMAEEARQAEIARQEADAREQAVRELAAKKAVEQREDRLRSFTLKESPALWSAYQTLQAEIENQNKKIEELEKTFANFGQDPKKDEDYKRICSMRDDMISSLKTLRSKIEDAYLAARKYEAFPSRKDYDELRSKLLEDGVREAEAATRKFDQMRDAK